MDFETAVSAALEHLPPGITLLAAVSGGADSTAMLAALAALRKKKDFILRVLHVEHGMRPAPESRGDAKAVVRLCGKLEVPCRVVTIAPGRIDKAAANRGIGPEAAARFFRHRALYREARSAGAARICVAHTHDDLLENILIRTLRGCGPAGLARMPAEKGLILRPILNLTRADVIKYLDEKGVEFRTDSSNADIRFFRNRVRHKLIPCLDMFFPGWRSSLLNLSGTQAGVAEFLLTEAGKRLPWNDGRALWINAAEFLAQPSIIREEAVFNACDRLARGKNFCKDAAPRRRSLRLLLDDLQKGKKTAGDLGPVRLEMKDGRITIRRAGEIFDSGFSMLIDSPGMYYLKGIKVTVTHLAKKVTVTNSGDVTKPEDDNYFFVRLPLVLKKSESGDFILRAGHKRRISDIFTVDNCITALDANGNAAFIAPDGNKKVSVFARDFNSADVKPGEIFSMCNITVEGGTDV